MAIDRRAIKLAKLNARREKELNTNEHSIEPTNQPNTHGQKKTLVQAPTKFTTGVTQEDDARIESRLQFSYLQDNLSLIGMSLTDFLNNEGVLLNKPERTVKTPFGDYQVVTTHLSYEQLKDMCVIDPDNVRDPAERTEEALFDIIDEIGSGLQITPILAYIDSKGKTSIPEGSRRYEAALLRKVGLDVDYFNPKPSSETIKWLVEASDKKVNFSYYDKGRLFQSLMTTHNWKQAELVRERKYTKQDVNRCVRFYNSPKELLTLLPSKRLPKASVDTFVSVAKELKTKNMVDDFKVAVTCLEFSKNQSSEDKSKAIVNLMREFVKGNTRKKDEPTHIFGNSKLYVSRSKSGANLNIKSIPQDKEEAVLTAIEQVLNSK
ncbi:hypothetical protein [Vibrio sp. R78045]|uniref:hypothetical protein n=1 Tax=Vibrio sp. R78045 TaxID=3093868 RepID=UPI0036F347C9